MRKLYSTVLPLLLTFAFAGHVAAQTTITTNHTYNNSSSMITFNVQNTNSSPIIITTVQTYLLTNTANAWQVLYNTAAINSSGSTWTQGVVGAGQNGWVLAGSGTINSTAGLYNLSTTLSITIPAGATYGICVGATTIGYMTLTAGAGVNTFSANGVNLKTGDNIGWGGAIPPATPVNYPRGFVGSITFVPAGPCIDPPVAGNVVSSSNPTCNGANFTLSLSGGTGGTGQTYQWQSSPDSINWTNIGGATSGSYTTSQSNTTYYRAQVTCGTGSSTSAGFKETNTICYCTSIPTSAIDEEIFSVTVNGSTNAYGCTTVAPGPGSILNRYSNFYPLGALTTIIPGTVVPFTILEDECDGATYYNNGCAVWIDFNQNGSFTDPGEQVYVEGTTTQSPRTISGTFTVPANAVPGLTGMRIIVAEGYSGTGLQPCMTYTYGETEDYIINIGSSTPCTGTPTGGNAVTSASAVCSNQTFNLSLAGSTLAGGLTYQWQSSPDSLAWTNIPGATNFTYSGTQAATTFYRAVVTCTNSSLSGTSAGVKILSLAAAPTPTITSSPADTVCAGTTVTLTTATCAGCNYNWSTGATTNSISVNTSSFYTVTVSNACGNGTASKEIVYKPSPSLSINGANAVCAGSSTTLVASGANSYSWSPATGLNTTTGPTVIATPTTSLTYTVTGSIGTCSQTLSVDVSVNPVPATPTVTASGPISFCQGSSVTFTSSATAGNQWYKDGNIITGATNQTYLANAAGSYTVRTTGNGCTSNASAAQAVTVNPTPPQPTITQNGNTLQSSASSGNQWFLNGASINGATAQNYSTTVAGLYSVQVTLNGCASPMSTAHVLTVTGFGSPVLDTKIKIAPNPVHDKLSIKYNGNAAKFTVMLISSNGTILSTGTFTTNYEIDMTRYSAGVYIVRIVNDKNGERTQRFIVKQ